MKAYERARRFLHPVAGQLATQVSVASGVLASDRAQAHAAASHGAAIEQVAWDFDAVYSAYAGFVWRSLARLGVPEQHLADATQDVFVVVHRRLADFEQRSSLKTWLFGIAVRVARDHARRARRRPSEPLPPGVPDGHTEAPFEHAARSEAVELLYRLLGELTGDQRAVFVLVELEQLTLPEAAAALEVNLHTLTSRLKTARQRFEAALRRHRAQNPPRRP